MQTKRSFKIVTICVCAVLILLAGVGATAAYIFVTGDTVSTQYDLPDVGCELVAGEDSYILTNTSNFPVYAKITVTWSSADALNISVDPASEWRALDSGSNYAVYYFPTAIGAGEAKTLLLNIGYAGEEDISLNAQAEVIQAMPTEAVQSWGLGVSADGTLFK